MQFILPLIVLFLVFLWFQNIPTSTQNSEPKRPIKIQIKDTSAIEKIRIAGSLAANVLEMITPYVREGTSTLELENICHDYIVNVQKSLPSLLNRFGFPKSICTSVNHTVCSGIPNERKLKSGDILSIFVAISKDGYNGHTSKMFLVGNCSLQAKRLVRITQECLYKAISTVKPGATLGDIGAIVQQHAETNRLSVVREYCGYGIGTDYHEESLQILNYGTAGTGITLKPGMTFTITPMLNIGKRYTQILPNQFTVITKDHSLSAQWMHTVLVTESGPEILTKRLEETVTY